MTQGPELLLWLPWYCLSVRRRGDDFVLAGISSIISMREMTQPRDALAGATENVSRAPLDVARRQSSFTEPCFCAVGSLNADARLRPGPFLHYQGICPLLGRPWKTDKEKGRTPRCPPLLYFRKPECQEAMAFGRGWPSSSVSRPLVRSSEVKRPPRWLSSSNVPFSMIRP